jgi:serine protease AprX
VVHLQGRPVYETYTQDPLCQAVEAAWQAGIVVVAGAGNDGRDNSFDSNGYGTIGSPRNDPYVITVGAMKTEGTPQRSDDLIASYSSKGPTSVDFFVKPDIVAPGNLVVSRLAPGTTLPTSIRPT